MRILQISAKKLFVFLLTGCVNAGCLAATFCSLFALWIFPTALCGRKYCFSLVPYSDANSTTTLSEILAIIIMLEWHYNSS